MSVTKLKKGSYLRGRRKKANFRNYNADLRVCCGLQHFCYDTALECLEYSVLVKGHKLSRGDSSKIYLKNLTVNGGGDGA